MVLVAETPFPISAQLSRIMTNDSSSDSATPLAENLWTTHEVAGFLHVSVKTIFNLRKNGLPFLQVGGAIRFVPQEVKEYLADSRRLSSHRWRQIIRNRRRPDD
jgi:excisionase family DNA binding protein